MDGSWWASRTSNPVPGANPVRGGFDSHTSPPPSRAVFLDRDGTLVELVDYLSDPAAVVLCKGAREGLAALRRDAGLVLVVVSNQSGLARGLLGPEQLRAVERRVAELLGDAAAPDLFLHCPHHPEGRVSELARACECRKPGTGLVEEARRRLGVEGGYLVGDSAADVECGRRAGLVTVRVRTGYGGAMEDPHRYDFQPPEPDHVADDIGAAARWVLEREAQA